MLRERKIRGIEIDTRTGEKRWTEGITYDKVPFFEALGIYAKRGINKVKGVIKRYGTRSNQSK